MNNTEKLRDALETYGCHSRDCSAWPSPEDADSGTDMPSSEPGECDCGLAAALAALAALHGEPPESPGCRHQCGPCRDEIGPWHERGCMRWSANIREARPAPADPTKWHTAEYVLDKLDEQARANEEAIRADERAKMNAPADALRAPMQISNALDSARAVRDFCKHEEYPELYSAEWQELTSLIDRLDTDFRRLDAALRGESPEPPQGEAGA